MRTRIIEPRRARIEPDERSTVDPLRWDPREIRGRPGFPSEPFPYPRSACGPGLNAADGLTLPRVRPDSAQLRSPWRGVRLATVLRTLIVVAISGYRLSQVVDDSFRAEAARTIGITRSNSSSSNVS